MMILVSTSGDYSNDFLFIFLILFNGGAMGVNASFAIKNWVTYQAQLREERFRY